MKVRVIGTVSTLFLGVAVMACGASSKRSGFDQDTDSTDPSSDDGSGNGTTGGGKLAGSGDQGAGSGSTCDINNTSPDPNKDYDGDGFALKDDCNECDPNTNAGAYDVPGNGLDEDCNGKPDDDTAECDDNLPIQGNDPFTGAQAIGLCKKASANGKEWGVISAKWTMPDGSSLSNMDGEGVLESFGSNAPQTGKAMLALSSGTARAPGQPGYDSPGGHDKGYTSGTPAGYPKEAPACSGSDPFGGLGGFGGAHDGAALELKIRVPSNAKSFAFQQNFFTYEFPDFICSEFNDFYVAMMDPKPAGLPDGNIAFDQDGNPISVNNSLLQVCDPQNAGGKNFSCPLGDSTLQGTGFESHAATGWLTTTAPVDPGSVITLRFAIWDQGDGILDSSVLVDDFKWSADAANGTVTQPSQPK